MPDIPNRDELERRLARMLGRANRTWLAKLLEYLGDPPSLDNVPADFWDKSGKELAQTLLPFSERVYLDAAERMLASVPIGVNWDLINTAASEWARGYTYDLIRGINETSRRAVQQAISAYFEQGLTIGDLRERLGRIYSPVRAEMIATTEVTRAASMGEQALAQEIANQGIQMTAVWQTNNDEMVCPICGPLHERPESEWRNAHPDGPPAHPRCRCWLNHEFTQ